MRITQSFIKSVKKYIAGKECGLILEHQFKKGLLLPPTKAMHVGTYFEFCLTGALPKDGKIPVPQMMKSGKDMMEPYRKARNDAEYVKKMIGYLGFKIIRSGVKLTRGNFEGTIDIIAEATRDVVISGAPGFVGELVIKASEQVVIDLKYSGLLDDQWSEMGWAFTDIQKEYHKTQAVQYHFISQMKFFYLITDSNHKEKDEDTGLAIDPKVKMVHVPVDDFMVEQHILEGNAMLEQFNIHSEFGFKALPSFNRCKDCQLSEMCVQKALVPEIEVVNVNVD